MHNAKIVLCEIGIESPAEPFVERLRNIDIRHADHNDFGSFEIINRWIDRLRAAR